MIPRRRSRQRGVLLGVVLVLLAVLFAAGIFALWSLRSETGSAGRDRLSRQLFDCAEQGLAYGKQYFSATIGTASIDTYLKADVCSTLPCTSSGGPFPTGGTAVAGYPDQAPFTQSIAMDSRLATGTYDFKYTFAVYNDPGDYGGTGHDTNSKIVIYSRCTDLNTSQQRSVSALISITASSSTDYTGQAGRGFRNQGNQNF